VPVLLSSRQRLLLKQQLLMEFISYLGTSISAEKLFCLNPKSKLASAGSIFSDTNPVDTASLYSTED
jgi:hypothetical protein